MIGGVHLVILIVVLLQVLVGIIVTIVDLAIEVHLIDVWRSRRGTLARMSSTCAWRSCARHASRDRLAAAEGEELERELGYRCMRTKNEDARMPRTADEQQNNQEQ